MQKAIQKKLKFRNVKEFKLNNTGKENAILLLNAGKCIFFLNFLLFKLKL